MKKSLSQGAMIGSLVAVIVVVVVAALLYFKPSFSSGPPLKPQGFKPPAGYDPNKGGKPMGAPANGGQSTTG